MREGRERERDNERSERVSVCEREGGWKRKRDTMRGRVRKREIHWERGEGGREKERNTLGEGGEREGGREKYIERREREGERR